VPSKRYFSPLVVSFVPGTNARTSFCSVAEQVDECRTLHYGCSTSECRLVAQWERERNQYFHKMHPKDVKYLNSIADASQYAVKRCKEADNVYIFHRTTSQGSEGMNAVNQEICSRIAVCPVNAAMLSIKAKCKRFRLQHAAAWSSSNELTPRGKQEYKEVFNGVNYRDFSINLFDRGNDGWEFSVLRNVVGGRMTNTVTIPKIPTKGSYFGRCTCGLAQHNAIPCEHMAAVLVSSQIPALSQTNIMLFWWMLAQWQLQYGKYVLTECFANMEVVRAEFQPDERNRYCPAWSAPNKAGCPPKGKRRKSVLEQAKGKRSQARPLTRFCQLCLQYSHCTVGCRRRTRNTVPKIGRTLTRRLTII
jgi:hypothetical protein